MNLYLLEVPEQPKYGVAAQRSYCCRSCGAHFINKAGIGSLRPALAQGTCELRYAGTCEVTA